MKRLLVLALPLVLLAGCKQEQASLPQAVAMTETALGHYCQMLLAEHPGPKAQVHLEGTEAPLFFSQVRDAISYERMPEQSHAIAAIYVNDMARAPSWEKPGLDNWIPAADAHYVVGSDKVGGMGAKELVPFSDAAAAAAFVEAHGGRIVRLDGIADEDVLAPAAEPGRHDGNSIDHEQQDFRERLNRLSAERQG